MKFLILSTPLTVIGVVLCKIKRFTFVHLFHQLKGYEGTLLSNLLKSKLLLFLMLWIVGRLVTVKPKVQNYCQIIRMLNTENGGQ